MKYQQSDYNLKDFELLFPYQLEYMNNYNFLNL